MAQWVDADEWMDGRMDVYQVHFLVQHPNNSFETRFYRPSSGPSFDRCPCIAERGGVNLRPASDSLLDR